MSSQAEGSWIDPWEGGFWSSLVRSRMHHSQRAALRWRGEVMSQDDVEGAQGDSASLQRCAWSDP